MAAATGDRSEGREPGELVQYTGASGYIYYKHAMVMLSGAGIVPVAQGAGASQARFLGVNASNVNRLTDSGASQKTIDLWKTGIFSFAANGTGASAHIGQRAYALDDQTVGVSAAVPVLYVGEIVGIPTTSIYRVRIDNAINGPFISGLSGFSVQN